ncbi:MAG: hypothetical protein QM608_01565 [Caulobacter sp.]
MKLAPGAPLAVNLTFDEAQDPLPTARLAMDQGLAQLEWAVARSACGSTISAPWIGWPWWGVRGAGSRNAAWHRRTAWF